MKIESAIKNKQLLAFDYGGFPRVVQPHILGIDTRGNLSLSCYQVGGGSNSGESIGWKMFHLDDIKNLTVLKEHFRNPRPEYNQQDPLFLTVQAQL